MGLEIERKFLVRSDKWRQFADAGTVMKQGYCAAGPNAVVRVRVAGGHGFLTVKGKTKGVSRSEFEYAVPLADAEAMLKEFCPENQVSKVRYIVMSGSDRWEVDEFTGLNAGLVTAELELTSEEQDFELPDWAGEEVSADPRYRNSYLARCPFVLWGLRTP